MKMVKGTSQARFAIFLCLDELYGRGIDLVENKGVEVDECLVEPGEMLHELLDGYFLCELE